MKVSTEQRKCSSNAKNLHSIMSIYFYGKNKTVQIDFNAKKIQAIMVNMLNYILQILLLI